MIHFPRNGGAGTVRRIGTQQARGEIVVWTDADLTYPNERIPEFIAMLAEDPVIDQVVGARTSEEGTLKIARVPAKWFVRKLAERLTNADIPDLNSGLRAFRRSVALPYLKLLPPGFSCVTTITLAFLSNGHEVRYVPIEYAKRAGRSKFHFFSDAYRYVLQVLRMVMYFNPLKVLMPPALFLLGLGVLKGIYDLVVHPLHFANDTLLIFVTGMILASLALLADLIVRSRGLSSAVSREREDRADRPGAPVQGRRRPAHHRTRAPAGGRGPRRHHRVLARPVSPAALPGPADRRRPRGRALPAHLPQAGLVPAGRLARRGPQARSADLVVFALLTPLQVPPVPGRPGRPRPPARAPPHRRHLPQRAAARTPPGRRGTDQSTAETRGHGDHALRRAGRASPGTGAGRDGADRTDASAPARAAREIIGPNGPRLPAPAQCRLLFFGIVRPYKGLDVLLRALAGAPAHVTLTVAGEFWGGTEQTEKLIADLGLRDRVTLRPGYLPATAIPALFAAADALVLPYREATASQNALLAFAHGVPVITTTAGALAEPVRDGVDGLTCAPDDAEDLLRALIQISDPRHGATASGGRQGLGP